MEDSSVNNQPIQTTQKEETVNLVTPPPTHATPAHPFPKFIPKRIAIIILLILVITLIVGFITTAYNLGKNQSNKETTQAPSITQSPTPTPDPTADWKTYRNDDLGFYFKYPSGWEDSSKLMTTKKISPIVSDYIFSPEAINDFKKNPNNAGMPSGFWIEYSLSNNPKLCGGDISIIDEITTFTLDNGQKGDYCTYNEKSDIQGAVFETQLKDSTLVFTLKEYYAENKTKITDYLKVFDQVVSTIQFTDSISEKTNTQPINIQNSNGDILMQAPKTSSISNFPSYSLFNIDNSEFKIESSGGREGPCTSDRTDNCTYDDEKYTSSNKDLKIDPLRIWRNDIGVFMLNPQSIYIGNKFLTDSLLITKTKPNTTFTAFEISEIKKIIDTIKSK